MSIDDYEKVLEQLVDANLFFVILSGGEPFAHPDISKLLYLAHDKFKHVLTLTNGTLLKAGHLKAIRKIVEEKGGFPIQVSLDSHEENINDMVRGKSELVIKNLEMLSQVGARVTIAMVISKTNKHSVISTVMKLSETIDSFHVMPIKEVKTSSKFDRNELLSMEELDEIWERLLCLKNELQINIRIPKEEIGKNQGCASGAPCMAGFSEMVIDPNLAVRPCDRVVDYFVGDLKYESVFDIWNGDRLKKVISCELPYCRVSDRNITIKSSEHSAASLCG